MRSGPEALVVGPSQGLLVAGWGDGVVVFDVAAETVHILEGSAAWLMSIEKPSPLGELAAEVARETGVPAAEAHEALVAGVELLASLGLTNRDHVVGPDRWSGSSLAGGGRPVGRCHPVLDERLAFRSSDAVWLAEVDEFFGRGLPGVEPTLIIDVEPGPDGGVRVTAQSEWRFPNREQFFVQLVDVVNEYAARTRDMAALHAGGVRTPGGEVWLLPGPIDSGKSTLVGALLQAGCAYLGDEVVGIRGPTLHAVPFPKPVSLDAASREVLGLGAVDRPHVSPSAIRAGAEVLSRDQGPIDRLIFPVFDPNQPASTEMLAPLAALKALLSNTLNLARAGAAGLQALCDLARSTPSVRVRHYDSPGLARLLIDQAYRLDNADGFDRALRHARRELRGGRVLSATYDGLAQARVQRVRALESRSVTVTDGRMFLAQDGRGGTWGLGGQAQDLWDRLDDSPAIADLVMARASAVGGSDDNAARDVVCVVDALVRKGLVALDGLSSGEWAVGVGGIAPNGTTTTHGYYLIPAHPRPDLGRWWSKAPWSSWEDHAAVKWWRSYRIITDHPRLIDALTALGCSAHPPVSVQQDERALTAVIRTLPAPDAGAVVSIAGHDLWWAPPGDEVASAAVILAHFAVEDLGGSAPLAATWIAAHNQQAAVFVGADPTRRRAAQSDATQRSPWRRCVGARVRNGRELWVPDPVSVLTWLEQGADPNAATEIWRRYELAAVAVSGVPSPRDGWVRVSESLAPRWSHAGGVLDHLLADGATDLIWDTGGHEAEAGSPSARRAEALIGVEHQASDVTRVGKTMGIQVQVPEWAAALGEVIIGDESGKVSANGIVLGRPLVRINLPVIDRAHPPGSGKLLHKAIVAACVDIGMPPGDASEAAAVAIATGHLYVGEERRARGQWRRKLYVKGIDDETWNSLTPTWSTSLTGWNRTPTWVAWKWTSAAPGRVERAVDLGFLNDAPTIGESIGPVLQNMGRRWADVVWQMLARLHLEPEDVPQEADALTVEETGRFTVDVIASGRWRHQVCGDLEPELRWLAAVAGRARADADRLVAWAATGDLANIIFGTDRYGDPFVNLYITSPGI